jgi:hypothetical protein
MEKMMSKAENKFAHVDKAVFALASALDSTLRVQSQIFHFEDMDEDYLNNWLQKEKDPVLGTVIAQLLGLRELSPADMPEDTDNAG